MKRILELINDVNEVPKMAEWIDLLAEEIGLPIDKTFQLNLALEEAVVNVMNYAFPGETNRVFTLEAEDFDDRITFVIDDTGVPFDPTQQEDPDLTLSAEERPIGGLGIMLVRQFMSNINYEYREGHNRLSLTMLRE